MRSRRTGSRSIRALPPTLPPAISTCARRYVESEYYENRAGINRTGRHHDHGPVGQPELFLPARENVSRGRRKQGHRSILHVELGDGENVAHDADGPFACLRSVKQRYGVGRGSAPWTWLASAGLAMSSNRSSVPTRTSGADRFGAVPPIVFCPV